MVTLCTCPLMPSNRKSMSKMSASKSSGASTTKKDQYEKKNEERKKEKKMAKTGVSGFFSLKRYPWHRFVRICF